MNTLYYGDNLDILRRYVKDESVDLIYLDPPFKSNQDYNVLFAEHSGEDSGAPQRAETNRKLLSAWRSAPKPLFEDADGRRLRTGEFQERNHVAKDSDA